MRRPATARRLPLALLLVVSLCDPAGAWAATAGKSEAERIAAPLLERRAERLVLARGPSLFAASPPEIDFQSGLTTSVILRVTARDGRGSEAVGGALVEIRYELWDEEFRLTAVDGAGQRRRFRLATKNELERWWRSPELTLLAASELALEDAWRVRLELVVVPFSAAEERDAQAWFSRSLDQAGETSTSTLSDAAPNRPIDVDRMLGLLMATSIQRRAVVERRWTLPVAPGRRE